MSKKNLTIISLAIIILSTSYFYLKKDKLPYKSFGYDYKNEKYLNRVKGEVQDFGSLDHQGVFHTLYKDSDAKAIVIISQGNDCPIIQKFSLIINEIKKKYESKNVIFYFLNSNRQDSRVDIIEEAKKYNYDLPILMDPSQVIADSLGITRTSEAVVITPEDWKIVYRGAISDRMNYGVDKQIAKNNYLENVLDAIISNKSIKLDKVAPAKGCLISFIEPKSISYEKVVAPLIAQKCLSCHTESLGYSPYFDNYEKLKGWVAMSKETIMTDRMPPWGADPLYGDYFENTSLTPDEKRTLIKWIDAGAPKDGKIDPLINANNRYGHRNEIVEKKIPIHTVKYTEKKIPPGGLIEYRYVELGQPVPYDMWVNGFRTLTTNPLQLHHETLMVTSKPLSFYEKLIHDKAVIDEESRKKNIDGDITMYVLGTINKYERKYAPDAYFRFMVWGRGIIQPKIFENSGLTIFIPKGSHLILESHYMGIGVEDEETSTFELYGQRTKPQGSRQMRSIYTTNSNFEIPPMVKSHFVTTPVWKTEKNIHIISFNGHMHIRGNAIRTEIKPPGGEFKTIFSIPKYNYGWQVGESIAPRYTIAVKAGTEFRTICNYNNSPQNPSNPDPTKTIHFGQRLDRSEMCIVHIAYTED